MRTVFIEKGVDGEILNPNLYAAFDGFSKRAYDIEFFHLLLPPGFTRENIVCGTIRSVRMAWRQLGVSAPPMLDYPPQLSKFLGRDIQASTLGEVRTDLFGPSPRAQFVKPRLLQKAFTGRVLTHSRDLIETSAFEPETAVWTSEPVHFITQYRAFVLENQLVGLKYYHGDFTRLIDVSTVFSAIDAYQHAPIAYALDFGLTADGRTLLIEVNDSFALGCYGLDSFLYASLVEARWDEICGN